MATVSNPASLSSVVSVFGSGGAPTSFSLYIRGGAQVSSANSSNISTTAVGLALSQFNGVTAASSLTASASPTSISGSNTGVPVRGSAQSNTTTVTPSGGSGTYTYAWTLINVSSGGPTLSSTTSASISVGASAFTGTITGTAQCTVRDSGTGATFVVNVAFQLSYGSTQ